MITGLALLVVGATGYAYLHFTNTHQTIQLGGIGLAILGSIVTVVGAILKQQSPAEVTKAASSFTTGPQTPPQYHCNQCGQNFWTQDDLQKHLTTVHGYSAKDPVIACEQCGKRFRTKSDLDWHLFEVHGVPLPGYSGGVRG